MAKGKKKGQAPQSCRDCERWPEVKGRIRVGESLRKVLAKMEAEMSKEEFRTTMADYLKLVQLEKDFDDNEAKEIRVTWVESTETSEPEK